MTIFKLHPDVENYRWLTLVNDSDQQWLDLADGAVPGSRALAVEWIEDELNRGKPKGDFPTLGTTPVFSERAVEALREFLTPNGELIPLSLPGESYFAFQATRVLDALDENQSTVVRFGSGRILDIQKYAFLKDRVATASIFRLPDFRGRVFVTEEFASKVGDAGLVGFDLKRLWSPDE